MTAIFINVHCKLGSEADKTQAKINKVGTVLNNANTTSQSGGKSKGIFSQVAESIEKTFSLDSAVMYAVKNVER